MLLWSVKIELLQRGYGGITAIDLASFHLSKSGR
jgi:hypothetical protein